MGGQLEQPVPRTLSGSPPSASAPLHTAVEQHPEELCFCSSDMRLKVREQMPHWYFFTSAWVCRWARRLERSAKARLQWGQEKGRSPAQGRAEAEVKQLFDISKPLPTY